MWRLQPPPPVGTPEGKRWFGRLAARGGLTDLTRHQGTKAFSFLAASYPTPHTANPRFPSPGPDTSSCLQTGAPPRQSRIPAGMGGQAGGGRSEGSAMETNFDPNCKAPTPYLLFKAHPFRRVNITPLLNPVPPSHIPVPDLQPLLIAGSYTPVLLRHSFGSSLTPSHLLPGNQSPTRAF
jgi:hypothetical protein